MANHNHRSFELRIFLTSGKRRRQIGPSGMIKLRLIVGLRSSGTVVEVPMSGICRCSTKFCLALVAKDLSEYPKGIISMTHQTGLHEFEFIDSIDRGWQLCESSALTAVGAELFPLGVSIITAGMEPVSVFRRVVDVRLSFDRLHYH